jgi:UDP-N-acetylmuramoyl-L-alanyl-D-glutamate--2,6-diaminopimelate ligase
VDYAHTPDALSNVLNTLRALNPHKLHCIFGCGGDRDATKRPEMGRIAAELADEVTVTSDNPRNESPEAIISEIAAGIPENSTKVNIEPDRRTAIITAIKQSQAGDIILIAGKGHENYQEIAGIKHPFDDRAIVREFLQ